MRNECQFSETPRECEGSRVEKMPFTDNLRDDLFQSSEEKESFQRDKIVFPFLLDDGTLLYVADDSKFDDAGNPILNQNGELQPNCRFEKNGISYQTDSDGRTGNLLAMTTEKHISMKAVTTWLTIVLRSTE